MKKIFSLLVFLLLVAFVLLTLYWKKESEKIEKGIQTHIDSLSNESDNFKLTYERIQTEGYPFEFKVALINPAIDFPSSKLHEELSGDLRTAGEIVMHFSLKGDLTTIQYAGDTIFTTSHPVNEKSSQYLFQGKALVVNDKAPLLKDAVKFLTEEQETSLWDEINVEKLAIHLEDVRLKSKTSGKSILSLGRFDADFSMLPKNEDNQKILFQLKASDVSYSQLLSYLMDKSEDGNFFDSLNKDFIEALYKQLGNVNEEFKFELDIHSLAKWSQVLKGFPMTLVQDGWPAAILKLQNAYQFKDKLAYEGELYFTVKNLAPEKEASTIESKVQYHFTKGYREALIATIRDVSKKAAALEVVTPEEKDFQDFVVSHRDLIEELVPNFEGFGVVESALNLELGVDKETLSIKVDLDTLEILTKLYGIKIQGKGEGSIGSFSGDLIFHLIHYKRLVKEAVAYINKCIAVANIAFKESLPHLEAISPSLEGKVLNFLNEIGDQQQKDSDHLTITVIANEELVTVGKVSGSEFLEKAHTLKDEMTKEVLPRIE